MEYEAEEEILTTDGDANSNVMTEDEREDEPTSELQAMLNYIQSLDSRLIQVEGNNSSSGLSTRLRNRTSHIRFNEPVPTTIVVG